MLHTGTLSFKSQSKNFASKRKKRKNSGLAGDLTSTLLCSSFLSSFCLPACGFGSGSGPPAVWQSHSSSCCVAERFRLVKTISHFKAPPLPQPSLSEAAE